MDQDEEIVPSVTGRSKLDQRALATIWAQNVLKDHPRIKPIDRPYIEAVLVEAALQEFPVKELAVGINDNGRHYKITIKGYKNLLDDVIWVNAFHGQHRNEMLDNVTKSYTQLTEVGAIKVIQVNKVTMNNHTQTDESITTPSASVRSRFKKRE